VTIIENRGPQNDETMVTAVERLRKPMSWLSGGIGAFMAIFSAPPNPSAVFYEWMEILGLALIIAALLGRIWSNLHIVGSKNTVLYHLGPYSLCRNPLYVSSFLGMIGVLLATKTPLLLPPLILWFMIYYRWTVNAEERRLRALFGEHFDTYCRVTPRFFPRFSNYRPAGEITVELALIFRRVADSMWFLWIFMILEIIDLLKHTTLNGHDLIPILVQTPF